MHVIRRTICFGKYDNIKCPAKSMRRPPVCILRVRVYVRVIFRLGLELLFMSLQGL